MAESVIRDEEIEDQESFEEVVADVIRDEDQENPQQETGQSQEEDWESRFKGLQARLQQEIEARRYTEAEKMQLEARLLQVSVQDMEPEDQQAAYAIWQQQQQVRQSQQQTAMTQAQMNEIAKVFVINKLSQQYGVPVKELEQFADPQSMEAHAKLVSQHRKSQRKQQRKETKADNFGSGGSGVSPKRKQPESLREARSAFAEAAKRMQRET